MKDRETLGVYEPAAFFERGNRDGILQDIFNSYRMAEEYGLTKPPLWVGLHYTNRQLQENPAAMQHLAAGYFELLVNHTLRDEGYQPVFPEQSGKSGRRTFYQFPLGNVVFGIQSPERFHQQLELDGFYDIDGFPTIIECKLAMSNTSLRQPIREFDTKIMRRFIHFVSEIAGIPQNQKYTMFVIVPDGVKRGEKRLRSWFSLKYVECGRAYDDLVVDALYFRHWLLGESRQ